MNEAIDWRDYTGTNPEKFFKSTLWQGEHLMIGLNCLEPSQVQNIHTHNGADKIYFVLEGHGRFTVGDRELEAAAGMLIAAPAGEPHGVTNTGSERLTMLVAIAPGFK